MSRPYDHDWQIVRLTILERDRYRCQIQLDGCEGTADRVDHIVPLDEGGARLDPNNLRASCRPCNTRRTVGRKAQLIAALTTRPNTTASRDW